MYLANVSNHNCLAASIKLFIAYRTVNGIVWTAANTAYSAQAVLDTYQEDPNTWEWSSDTASRHKMPGISTQGPMSCFLYLAVKDGGHSRILLEHLCQRLKKGNIPDSSPLLTFRNHAIKHNQRKRTSQQFLADYIKVFNSIYEGRNIIKFFHSAITPMPAVVPCQVGNSLDPEDYFAESC